MSRPQKPSVPGDPSQHDLVTKIGIMVREAHDADKLPALFDIIAGWFRANFDTAAFAEGGVLGPVKEED